MRTRGDMVTAVTGEDQLRAASGEEYNPGAPTTPRQAATVILVRDGGVPRDDGQPAGQAPEALEVLLVLRNPAARFMGGVWVFPGGALEPSERAHAQAVRRELFEEAGVALSNDAELITFSRWITPSVVKVRFDTVFFLALMPADQNVAVDEQECIDYRWLVPADALAAHAAGELPLVFPTIKHLEQLSDFSSADELLNHARGRAVGPVQPKVIADGNGGGRVVLPGEPGY